MSSIPILWRYNYNTCIISIFIDNNIYTNIYNDLEKMVKLEYKYTNIIQYMLLSSICYHYYLYQ